MASIIGFDATLRDPLARYTRLPVGATTVFQGIVGDGKGNVVQRDLFTVPGSPDLFHLQSDYKTVSPTVEAMPNVDPSAFASSSRTNANAGGFTNPFNYGRLVYDVSSPANPASLNLANVLGGGTSGKAVNAPMKSGKGVLLAVGGIAVLGFGLYFFLR